MENKTTSKNRLINIARGALVAGCLVIAPAAMANNTMHSSPEGADYLMSYGSHHYDGGGRRGGFGGGVGDFGGSQSVPEPATWGMFGLGLAMIGFGAVRRRRVQND